MKIPPPSDLDALPALGLLLVLDLAAALTANALRAQHIQIMGDFDPAEDELVTAARVLATECEMLRTAVIHFRRRALVQLADERRAWPF